MICVEMYDKLRHFERLINMQLREADKQELLASTGLPSVQKGLAQSVQLSDIVCYVYLHEEEIIAISGAATTPHEGLATVWAMGTNKVLAFWGEVEPLFIKHVNGVLDFEGVEVIGNVIDLRNEIHIRWIQKLGFTMTGQVVELGGYKFESFYKRK